MKKNIVMLDKNNKEIECDVLIEFEFDNNKYIVYTDNIVDKNGDYTFYKGMFNEQGDICDPTDVDVNEIFETLITDYKNKIMRGEI